MIKTFYKTILLLSLLSLASCEKWDLDKVNILSVTTGPISATPPTTISLQSEVSGLENGKIIEHGHIYSYVNPLPELDLPDVISSNLGIKSSNGSFDNTITTLNLNTTYYVRAFAFAENRPEATYGEVVEIRLGDNELEVTTDSVNLYTGAFEVFGTLTGIQTGVTVPRHGFIWSHENEAPTIENDQVIYLGEVKNDTSFHERLDNIEQLKTYHVRAFAQLGKAVFYGETKSFFKGDVWTRKEDALFPQVATYQSGIGDAGYIGGGASNPPFYSNPSSRVQKYTPATDSWEIETMSLGFTSVFGAAFSIDETMYVSTGSYYGNIGNDLWAYNTASGSWSQRSPFPGPELDRTMVTTIQGKGYVGCGTNITLNQFQTRIWVYDPVSNNWDIIPNLPGNNNRKIPFIFSNENELFLGFGEGGWDQDFWRYNVNTETWNQMPFIQLPDLFPIGISGFSVGDKGYIVTTVLQNNFWEYDMKRNRWRTKANYPGPQRQDPAYFTLDGKCYYGLGRDINLDVDLKDLWEYIPDKEL